jgi:hypothetical protein
MSDAWRMESAAEDCRRATRDLSAGAERFSSNVFSISQATDRLGQHVWDMRDLVERFEKLSVANRYRELCVCIMRDLRAACVGQVFDADYLDKLEAKIVEVGG